MSLDFYLEEIKPCEVFSVNITHNLGKMATEAGIYQHLWHPDELGIVVAKDLIKPLQAGLRKLSDEPEKYRKLNPKNGWGDYEGFFRAVTSVLQACIDNPDAIVKTCT